MLDLLQNVDPADLIAYSRQVPTPDDYLLTREIVPERQIQNVKYRVRSRTKRVNAAKFRAYDTETPRGRREVEHSVLEGFLPPLGVKLSVGELETILLSLDRGGDDQELVDALYDDIETEVLGIKARLELAAGDLLADGKFTLVDENRLTLEADYQVDAGFRPTAAKFWSDPTATILDDEQAWIQKLIDDGTGRPGDAMASRAVIAHLARNNQYKQAFFGSNAEQRPTLTPGQVQSVRDTYGLATIREYDAKVRVDGVQTRTTPENRFFLLPANKEEFAETQYGITAEALALSRAGNPRIEREDQPGIVVTAKEYDDPVDVTTKATAVAMPVLYDNEGYISAQVLA